MRDDDNGAVPHDTGTSMFPDAWAALIVLESNVFFPRFGLAS